MDGSDGSSILGEDGHGARGSQAPHTNNLVRTAGSQQPIVLNIKEANSFLYFLLFLHDSN